MAAIEDRERAVLIDLSRAESTAEAVRLLESQLATSNHVISGGGVVDINTGDLLLTPGVLSKFKTVMSRLGSRINTLYSTIPQTQQSALDEGFMVRRMPPEAKSRIEAKPFFDNANFEVDLPFTETSGASHLSMTLDDGSRQALDIRSDAIQETMFYRQNLRSGQVLEASGNIVVIGDAHSGSEILAGGDILVWGVLGGIAHAGKDGYQSAQIRALKIEAVQLRIANLIARRPDRLFKHEQPGANRGPEVAKIKQGEIQIFEEPIDW